MQYYKLDWSQDPKVVGVRDGLGQGILDDSFYKRHPWYEKIFITDTIVNKTRDWWKPLANMPDYGAPLKRVKIEKRAKLTDFIDFGGFRAGYLVNDRLRALLEQAHLPRHAYFPATLQQGEQEITDYWWLVYDLETGEHTVDFSRSEFRELLAKAGFLGREIGINYYADYMSNLDTHGRGLPTKILHLNSSFDQSLDIWGTQFLTLTKGYISQRLLKLFEQNSITGYDARKVPDTLEGLPEHSLQRALIFC